LTPSSIQKTALANGLRIVTETIPSVRSVAVGCWIDNGSRFESARLNGISHFVEHMVFKGTKNRKVQQIGRSMESVGGYLNAFTGREHTCFYARCLDEQLPKAIDITTDLVLNPVFPKREIEREKDVVVEEMRMYADSPEDVVFEQFDKTLYPKHSLGRPIIGSEKTVRSISQEDLFRFTKNTFAAERLVISVAGNATHSEVVEHVEQALEKGSKISKKGRVNRNSTLPRYYPKDVSITNKQFHQSHILVGRRTIGLNSSKRLKLTLINSVLGGGMSSRLNQNIREKYGYCYNIYSFANMISNTGEFGVYMATDPQKVDRSRTLIFSELSKLKQKPLGKTRLKQAKNQLKGSMMLGLENMSTRMMRLGKLELYYGDIKSLDATIAALDKISVDALHEMSSKVLDPSKYSVIS